MSAADIIKALAVAAELTQTELSAIALKTMADDLKAYPEPAVLQALTRCRKELRHRLTLADIIDRLGQSDGRPGADEAWAMALDAVDERLTVVWSDEMAEAFAIARPILSVGDKVGARMAFRDAYERIVRQGREAGRRPAWSASLGWDVAQRQGALQMAERAGLLAAPVVAALLPAPRGGVIEDLLAGKAVVDDGSRIAQWCQRLRETLRATQVARRQAVEAAAAAQRQREAAAKQTVADLIAGATR